MGQGIDPSFDPLVSNICQCEPAEGGQCHSIGDFGRAGLYAANNRDANHMALLGIALI